MAPADMPLARRLELALARAKPRVWPLSRQSLPSWFSAMSLLFAVFLRAFLKRMRSQAFKRAHAKKCIVTLTTMEVINKFVREKEEEAKADAKDGEEVELDCLPEASRIFRLLWDDVHECRTALYGFDVADRRNRDTEALLKRVAADELRKAIRLTRRARDPEVQTASADESRELGGHWSGDKLEEKIKFAKEVQSCLGRDFVDSKLLAEARALLRKVRSDQRRNLKLLSKLVTPVMPTVILVCCLSSLREALRSVFHQIGAWALPIEAAVAGQRGKTRSYLLWLFFGHLLIDVTNMLESGYRQRACQHLGERIRNGVMKAIVQQDYEFFDRNSPDVLQERLNCDADELGSDLVNKPNEILSQAIGIILNAYGARIQCSSKLFYMAMAPLVPVIMSQRKLIKYITRMNDRERKIYERTAANTGEVLREIRTVRQFAMEQREVTEFARSHEMMEEMSARVVVCARIIETIFGMTIYGGLIATASMGAQEVVAGKMQVSQLLDIMFKLNFNVVFPTRSLLENLPNALNMSKPLGRICDLLESNPKIEPTDADRKWLEAGSPRELRAMLEACQEVVDGPFQERRLVVEAKQGICKVADVTAVPSGAQLVLLRSRGEEKPVHDKGSVRPEELSYPVSVCFSEKVRPSRFHGLIEFDNVHFAYPTNPQKPVLNGISFTVQPGQKVALVGHTGCGKSSIMALLQRLYHPQKGSIKVDGRPIEDYDVHFLRSRMVIVDQLTILFSTTLRDNITYGLEGKVDDKLIEQVCREACAWSFIEGKPDNLMSEILSRGSNLSGGERQRVAIARAMVRRPDVILLDEATSALDTKNERVVQEALDKLARQGSALVIAHRLSTIQDSDKIVVVDQGLCAEEGTHDELLRKPSEKEEGGAPRRPGAATPPVPGRSGAGAGAAPPPPPLPGQLLAGEAAELGPPASLKRETSAPPVISRADGRAGHNGKVSYRSLWESSKGSERMTVQQLQKRIEQLEGELSGLKGRRDQIRSYMSEALESKTSRRTDVPPPAFLARQCSA